MRSNPTAFVPSVAFHPGDTLAEKLTELKMPVKEFATRVNKPEKTIHAILNQSSSITPDMAVLFEHVLGIPAQFWLNKQANYDEYSARQKAKAEQSERQTWANCFPHKEMGKFGWINPNVPTELSDALFSFFQVGNQYAWQECYATVRPNYRISTAHAHEVYPVSAWLRQGERIAESLSVSAFDKKATVAALPLFKQIMCEASPDFFSQMQALCARLGIKLIYVPNLPKAPIAGCARWYQNYPLIQISARQKRYDSLWFTFFHELGHILLHGKTEIFVEDIKYDQLNEEKENQANQFAQKQLIPEKLIEEMRAVGVHTADSLRTYAQSADTHVAVLHGRLQYDGVISHGQFNELRLGLQTDYQRVGLV